MKFYGIKASKKRGEGEEVKELTTPQKQNIARKTDAFLESNDGATIFFVAIDDVMDIVCLLKDNEGDEKALAQRFLEKVGRDYDEVESEEISMLTFLNSIRNAYRNRLITDDDRMAEHAGMTNFFEESYNFIGEKIADDKKSAEELLAEVERLHLGRAYKEELERVFKGKKCEHFIGNPASYLIVSKESEARRSMLRGLILALYEKGRLQSKRYTIVDMSYRDCSVSALEELYAINQGATVYLKTCQGNFQDGERATSYMDVKKACRVAKKYGAKTLTVICMDRASDKYRNMIENYMMGAPLVVFTDDLYSKEAAQNILKEMAEKEGFTISESLLEKVQRSERAYVYSDLLEIYNIWRAEYMSKEIFPEYSKYYTQALEEEESKKQATGAYKKLQDMIGLTEAKKVIDGAINYFKLQQEYKNREIGFNRPAMHMCFTGHPGTAKTTVARLVAQILKDNEILSEGKLIEVGRSQLVGEYVGTTAPKVREAFDKAKGSVLFIDEAYSLMDDRKGLYGTEAINTIVQEMENRREDTIVIFAGYEKEMANFLEWNPGLKSRIAFHVPFENYTTEELLQITEHIAKERGMKIAEDAKEKLVEIYDESRKDDAFGNGRYVRNLLEKAKFKQANRLVKRELQFVSDDELCTLVADDFEMVKKKVEERPRLGFYA